MKYLFRPTAEKQFAKLDADIQSIIINKLTFYLSTAKPLLFAKRLRHVGGGQYRFRVGDYRIIFDVVENIIVVLAIGHRREIYKA